MMTWFVNGNEVTPDQMREMAATVPDPIYNHERIDDCRAELMRAGHVVTGNKYGRQIFFERPYHA